MIGAQPVLLPLPQMVHALTPGPVLGALAALRRWALGWCRLGQLLVGVLLVSRLMAIDSWDRCWLGLSMPYSLWANSFRLCLHIVRADGCWAKLLLVLDTLYLLAASVPNLLMVLLGVFDLLCVKRCQAEFTLAVALLCGLELALQLLELRLLHCRRPSPTAAAEQKSEKTAAVVWRCSASTTTATPGKLLLKTTAGEEGQQDWIVVPQPSVGGVGQEASTV